jgi:hypothetical protein
MQPSKAVFIARFKHYLPEWLRETTVTGNRVSDKLGEIRTGCYSYTFLEPYRYSDLLCIEKRLGFARERTKGYTANALGV